LLRSAERLTKAVAKPFGSEKRRSAKVKSCALDALSAGIMIVDVDLNVILVNDALTSLLRNAEADIKLQLRHGISVRGNPRTASQHVRRSAERDSVAYREFWASLGRGKYQAGEFKRIASGGRDVWIQASYNPILDLNGKPSKVVKAAAEAASIGG
jgi:methyl-accepting chemotaxis protein